MSVTYSNIHKNMTSLEYKPISLNWRFWGGNIFLQSRPFLIYFCTSYVAFMCLTKGRHSMNINELTLYTKYSINIHLLFQTNYMSFIILPTYFSTFLLFVYFVHILITICWTLVKGYKDSVTVSTVNIVLYTWNFLWVDLKCFTTLIHTQ